MFPNHHYKLPFRISLTNNFYKGKILYQYVMFFTRVLRMIYFKLHKKPKKKPVLLTRGKFE